MDESHLIKGIQEGDRKAFQILVETHLRMVVSTCMGIVHNKVDAEIMEISLASVETLIHRAKKNLQSQLLDSYKKNNI
jgi:hypothetical protein